MRSSTLLSASILFFASFGLAQAATWNVGCTNGVCVIIDGDGNMNYFDGGQKKINGTGKINGLKGPAAISCNAVSGNEGCVVVDSTGQIWIGSPRPPNNFELVTKIK